MKTRNILLACGIALLLIGVTAAITLLPAQSNDEQLEEYEGTDREFVVFEQIDHITHDVELPETMTFCGEEVPLDLFFVRERLERELMVNSYRHSATILQLKRTTRWFAGTDGKLIQTFRNHIAVEAHHTLVSSHGAYHGAIRTARRFQVSRHD